MTRSEDPNSSPNVSVKSTGSEKSENNSPLKFITGSKYIKKEAVFQEHPGEFLNATLLDFFFDKQERKKYYQEIKNTTFASIYDAFNAHYYLPEAGQYNLRESFKASNEKNQSNRALIFLRCFTGEKENDRPFNELSNVGKAWRGIIRTARTINNILRLPELAFRVADYGFQSAFIQLRNYVKNSNNNPVSRGIAAMTVLPISWIAHKVAKAAFLTYSALPWASPLESFDRAKERDYENSNRLTKAVETYDNNSPLKSQIAFTLSHLCFGWRALSVITTLAPLAALNVVGLAIAGVGISTVVAPAVFSAGSQTTTVSAIALGSVSNVNTVVQVVKANTQSKESTANIYQSLKSNASSQSLFTPDPNDPVDTLTNSKSSSETDEAVQFLHDITRTSPPPSPSKSTNARTPPPASAEEIFQHAHHDCTNLTSSKQINSPTNTARTFSPTHTSGSNN